MENYQKYKWFFTSSGNLVVGGKSASQNDELLKKIKQRKEEHLVMHTSEPGSPFTVIANEVSKLTDKDIDECAIFTGCFSRAWKLGKKKTIVDIFKSSQVHKDKKMKVGTWSVVGKISKKTIELKLALTRQNGILRAVPFSTVKKADILLKVCPGKIDKKDMLAKMQMELDEDLSQEELLSALPAGGVAVCRE